MTRKVKFAPNYDFSDENFIRLKDELLLQLKTKFQQKLNNARDKPYLLELEKNELTEQQKRTLEVYGQLLLDEFDDVFKSNSKPIKDIISDFVSKYSKTAAKWAKSYEIENIQANSEFKNRTSDGEFTILAMMSTWIKENSGFNGKPTEVNNCPFDITRTDAQYYYEKLAEYQAKKEYAAFIDGFEFNNDVKKTDKLAKATKEYTLARQILAIHHVLIEFGLLEAYTNKSDVARLYHLFAGKEVTDIANSVIYDRMKNPNASDKREIADYLFVIRHFEKLKAPTGSGIDNIITRLKKDMG